MRPRVTRMTGICGPDRRSFSIAFREMETHLGFVSVGISIRIPLFHARFSLLYEVEFFERLKGSIERKEPLVRDLYDADGILRLRAKCCENGVLWELEWKGIYPVDLSSPEQENSSLRISDLRVETGVASRPDL